MQTSNDLSKYELQKLRACPTRSMCPFRDICAASSESSGRLIYPMVVNAQRGDLFWGTRFSESRALVFKSGVFLSAGYSNQGGEVPFCLYGPGNSVGFTDMFTAEAIRSSYYVRTLLNGEVCSFSADVVAKELERFSHDYVQDLAISTLMSQCAGAFSISMIRHQKSVSDKVVAFLYCLNDLTSRIGTSQTEFKITHEDIAAIVGANRATTTRVLNNLVTSNLVEMEYGIVKLLPEGLNNPSKKEEYHTNLILPKSHGALGEALSGEYVFR